VFDEKNVILPENNSMTGDAVLDGLYFEEENIAEDIIDLDSLAAQIENNDI
jgi:hypothetical protein